MRAKTAQKREASPVSEEEIGPYLASVFSSRFFAPGPLKEKRDWVQTRFPSWVEAARRLGDEILREEKTERVLPKKSFFRRWRRNGAASARENGFSPVGFDSLLRLGRAAWSADDPIFRDKIVAKIEGALSGKRFLSGGDLWKGIWLLYFLAEDSAAPNRKRLMTRLWNLLQEGAAHGADREAGSRTSHRKAGSRTSHRGGAERGLFLLWMGTLFLELPRAHSWRDQGGRLLDEALFRSVGSDGACRSGRLSDQVGLLQIYLQALPIGRRMGGAGDRVERRIERMLEFLAAHRSYSLWPFERPEAGLAEETPPLSSSRPNEIDSVEKTLGIGAILFGRGDFKEATAPFSEEAFLITGEEGYAVYQRLAPPSRSPSIVFEEGGYAVLRAAALDPPGERALVFRAAAGLSLSLMGGGKTLLSLGSIGDSNGGRADSPFLARLFPMRERPSRNREAGSRTFHREAGSRTPYRAVLFSRRFLGEDFDYLEARRKEGTSDAIRRRVLFVRPDYWIVDDSFSGEEALQPEWVFVYPSRGEARGNLDEGVHIQSPEWGRLWMVPFGTHLNGIEIRDQDEEKKVQVHCAGAPPLSLTTLFYPEAPSSPCRHDFKSLYFPSAAGGTAFETLTSSRTDTILIAPPSKRIARSEIRFEGEILFIRRDYRGEIARLFVVSGSSCLWEGKLLFESRRPIPFLELSYTGSVLSVRGELSGPVSLYADGVEEVRLNGKKACFTRDRGRLILHLGE